MLRRARCPRRALRGPKQEIAGFTLVEIGLAMTVLLVALMAMGASTLRMSSLRRQNRERAIAQNAIRTMSEQVHATSDRIRREGGPWAEELIAELSEDGDLGATFSIRSLSPQVGEQTVGTIQVVIDETVTDDTLGFELGLPRDLDGDGNVDNVDVSATAQILPVIIRARWRGVSGEVQISHPFYVIGY
jgi:Tfp pilus assembly protein PilV